MYKDIPLNPSEKFAEDLEAIRGSMEILFAFSPGQRLFNPNFGCDLEAILFELIDEKMTSIILRELTTCITKWDPRIRINHFQSKVTPSYEENRYDLELVFQISGYEGNFTYEGVLNRKYE